MSVFRKLLYISFGLALIPFAVIAETTGIYAVKDVASNDVLNVRKGPGVKHRDLGDLTHDGRVQVIGFNDTGTWAEIPWEEGTAWVSARYLSLVHADGAVQAFVMPDPLTCAGTEPFWSANVSPEAVSLQMLDGPGVAGDVEWSSPAPGRPNDFIIGFSATPLTGVLTKESCSDGMSDIDHPWSLVLINRSGEGPHVVEGCCQ